MSFRKSEELFKSDRTQSAHGRPNRPGGGFDPASFARVVRERYPVKTAAHLAVIAERSERCARQWLDGQSKPDADSLSRLLSHFGAVLLPVLARGVNWADSFARAEEREELARKMKQLEEQGEGW